MRIGIAETHATELVAKSIKETLSDAGFESFYLKNNSKTTMADLVIVLDVQQEESFARKKQNRDKFEKNKQFSNKISQGYRKLAKKKGWKIVNASQSKGEVHKDVMKIVAKKMGL